MEPDGIKKDDSIKETLPGSGGETILVVDDDDGYRKLMSLALTENGYIVIEARGGMEGLEIFKNQKKKIDLILTDIVMPGMDGVQLIEHVRGISPRMKVIFISGYKREFKQDINGQPVNFIEKTSGLSSLIEKVREVLNETGLIKKWLKKILP